jgi:hypothetical protein
MSQYQSSKRSKQMAFKSYREPKTPNDTQALARTTAEWLVEEEKARARFRKADNGRARQTADDRVQYCRVARMLIERASA